MSQIVDETGALVPCYLAVTGRGGVQMIDADHVEAARAMARHIDPTGMVIETAMPFAIVVGTEVVEANFGHGFNREVANLQRAADVIHGLRTW